MAGGLTMPAAPYTTPLAEYRLRLRDSSLVAVAEVSNWSKLTYVPRFNDVGSWMLDGIPRLALDAASGQWLLDPVFSVLSANTPAGYGIVVDRRIPPSVTWSEIFSGPIDAPRRVFNASFDGYNLAGPDDNHVLLDRLAHPSPVTLDFATQADDPQSAVLASTALLHYVDRNAGPGAGTHGGVSRVTPGLALAADPLVGSAVTNTARLQTLLSLLQEIAVAGGDVGFRVVQSGAGRVFSVYAPVDISSTAVFSPDLTDLFSFDFALGAPKANYVYVGGSGVGTARTVVEGGDLASVAAWGRVIETWVDRQDSADATLLGQERDLTLDQMKATTAVDFDPAETPRLRYGVDYNLGDRVSVVVDGTVFVDLIREVRVEVSKDGEKVTPTVGTVGSHPVRGLGLFAKIRQLDTRVRQKERT